MAGKHPTERDQTMSSIYEQQGLSLPRLQHAAMGIPSGAQEQVRAFYGGILGLREKPVPESLRALGVLWFATGDSELELHFTPDDNHPANPEEKRHICLEVADVAAYRAYIERSGYTTFDGSAIPNRPRFFCHDPFGNCLEFTTIEGDYLT